MSGLEFANSQLEVVTHASIDWSTHGDLMASLDAELAKLKQRIETVTSVHAFVVEFDAICTRDIDSGKLAPTTQLHDLLQTTLKLFQQACGEILKDAAEFTRKGIPVIGLAAIKKIHAEPGDGLQMAQMLGLASQLNAGDGQPPHEVEFPEEIHAVMAGKNKPFANIA